MRRRRTPVPGDGTRSRSQPSLSSKGTKLASVRCWGFSADPAFKQTFVGAIALFNPATGKFLRDLTTTAHADGAPTISPDGKQVAFTRGEDLYVVPVAGGRPELLRQGVRDPRWGAR